MQRTLQDIAAERIKDKTKAETRKAECQRQKEAETAYTKAWQNFVNACCLKLPDEQAGQAVATLADMLRERGLRSRLEEADQRYQDRSGESYIVKVLLAAYDGHADGATLNAAREWGLDPNLGLSDEADNVRHAVMFGFSPLTSKKEEKPTIQPATPKTKQPPAKEKRPKANDLMTLTLERNPESANWSISQWVEYTKRGRATIQATDQWKRLQAAHAIVKVDRLTAQQKLRSLDCKGIDHRRQGRNMD